ncbi:MAG: B12-binding domain-containing protein [Promethearchaeota archaeon]
MEHINLEEVNKTQNEEYFINKIIEAVETLDFYSMKDSIKEALNAGVSSIDIIKKGVLEALEESGDMGLILAAEALESELLLIDEKKQKELNKAQNFSGKVVVGTIKGDIHNLGKNILIALMKSYGMDVIDLGIDVEPEKFLQYAELPDVKVIGISYLLSAGEPAIKKTLSLLKNNELNNKVKIILGGAAASKEIAEETNADAYAIDALMGVEIIDKWLRE